jgi:hypothetical protein
LALIQGALDSGQITADNHQELQGLGVLFGDALVAELDLKWVVVTDDFGTWPVVTRPRTSLQIAAFTAFEKRVMNKEAPIEVVALFNGFCHVAKQALRPKKSLWSRLFGRHSA